MARIALALGAEEPSSVGRWPFSDRECSVPFKLNQAGCRHIPRQKHKLTNRPASDTSLRYIPIALVAEVEGHKAQLSANANGAVTFEEADGHP